MEQKRENWLDAVRAFACACVIMVHSPAKYDGLIPGQYALAPLNYILMAWGVGLFFALSGSLLLSKPVPLTTFYKKRFPRLIMPVLLWSVIYIVYDGWIDGNLTWSNFMTRLIMIPFDAQTPHLWFMYTLFGIYLVTPVFAMFLSKASKRDVEILLCVWGVTLCVPYLELCNPKIASVLTGNGILHNFSGFLWYAILGFYLRKYNNWKINGWKFITLVVVSFGFPLIINFSGILPLDVLNTQMSLSSVAMTAIPFILFKNISLSQKIGGGIAQFSKYSFGIYLFHMVILKPLRPFLTQYHINYVIQIPVTALLVGLFSYVFIRLLSKLPYSKYLLG